MGVRVGREWDWKSGIGRVVGRVGVGRSGVGVRVIVEVVSTVQLYHFFKQICMQ